ncbi:MULTISPECIES: DUF1553 domain-containing protein [unclassified Spirosoma]|uniref:DUF1553 domain-containing protein n=1 Tax=unclassified Spirosoma TaxID=2621999 RepID=UPI0009641D1F|nr:MULTISPECIES: DUF1553 domain-containing protein [unclassified Spirosoma]MBN8821012.1 DUF1553 domain-containing protein [Spirosoma sp.]OJW76016.1 MAG: hypothetical protein BGO59_04085 [Spirosoma sp. 48-14]
MRRIPPIPFTYPYLLLLASLLGFCAVGFLQSCSHVDKPVAILQLADKLPETVDYNLHVKPILSDKCFFCHGPDKNSQKAGLELATREGALAALKKAKGKHAIVPGDLANSEVYHRIITTDEHEMMPPKASNRVLSDYEKAILVKWIEQGAEYKPHWALIKPRQSELPTVSNTRWPKNPIDYFILQKLDEKGLKPSPEADKETLLRRVTLDLTGLPPTLNEIDAFLADNSPNAYEKVVDRLLKSPHYGEKMAVDWLDLARYADTHGYTVDRYRPMWPWRDWVIQAFNRNQSFSQFLTWQLAGDLLPHRNNDPTSREQRLATAFNRNHSQNMEGGIINEEFRVEYVADRTNTLGTAMLGLTVECARCHDHKFDPISQKDYYSLFAFFNNVDEIGQISWDDATPVPTMLLSDKKQDSLLAFIDTRIKTAEQSLNKTIATEKQSLTTWKTDNHNTVTFDPRKGLQARFTFDKLVNGQFISEVSPVDKGTVVDPVLAAGKFGQAFQSNGDDILNLGKVGIFNRAQPFSIGVWVNIPNGLNKGVILHKGQGDILYNFRGYFLNIRDGKAELRMAHTWPYNSINRVSQQSLPKQKWIHLTMTYDGSSKANGLKLYLDGREMAMTTERDNLYKDITFARSLSKDQPGLQVGADMRGTGIKNGLVDELVVYNRELTAPEVALLAQSSGSSSPLSTTVSDPNALLTYYLANVSVPYQQQRETIQQLRTERNRQVEAVPELMVMEEMKTPRPTYLLKRGVYDAHGERVRPDVPASILPFPANFPRNRLGLAQWLLHPDNPLTARVVVNRYWQTYFGTGLQKSSNNFGNQGGLPSHPELLDWLAINFREYNWNMKAMQKLIVMSATYRQSSRTTKESLRQDPENIWLSRGPMSRLTAEMVRDNALAASGLLSAKIGGPSVKPYQPEGLWAVNNTTYEQDKGESLYRRSLYTFWRRTNPPPSMNTFDAPSRSYCVVQRQKTSTPLQALVLLNDPQFVEAAKVVAERSFTRSTSLPERLTNLFRLLTSRKPIPTEMAILTRLYEQEYQKFKKNPPKMNGWLQAGEYKLTGNTDKPALAAGAVVASTVMNSEAFITKH